VTAGTPATLSRDAVEVSSNGDALVDFGTAQKDVYHVASARSLIAWDIGTDQSVTFDDPTAGDITQAWTRGGNVVAQMVTEFGQDVDGNETITQTESRGGINISTVTTFSADGSISVVRQEVE
jgi:hypothetical protein